MDHAGAGPDDQRGGATELLQQVRRWIENYCKVKDDLEKISEINRELLRRERKRKARK